MLRDSTATNGLRGKLTKELLLLDTTTLAIASPDVPVAPVGRPDILLRDTFDATRHRLKVKGLATRTGDEYIAEGEAFRRHFRDVHGFEPALSDLTVANADRFLLSSQERAAGRGTPWVKATMEYHVTQLRRFGAYLATALGLPTNPIAGLSAGRDKRKRSTREGDALPDPQLVDVLNGLDPSKPYAMVTRGLIALCYEGGPRTSELARLDVEDLRIARVDGFELGPVIDIRAPAKTSPPRIIPLGVRAEEYIRDAIANRTSGPLFPGRDGERMTPRATRDRIVRAGPGSASRSTPSACVGARRVGKLPTLPVPGTRIRSSAGLLTRGT